MIQAWLARKTGMVQTLERLAVLEHELSSARSAIAALTERLAAAEAHSAAAATMNERLDQHVRVLIRTARAGAFRLRRLSTADMENTARGKTLEKEVGRLSAALIVIENKVETEAEQIRRSVTGLLRQMRVGKSENPAG